MKRIVATAAVAIFVLFLGLGAAVAAIGLPLADIRPASVPLQPDPVSEQRGRALLASAYLAHGGAQAVTRHTTATFDMTDTWVGMGTLFNPWPDDAQQLTMTTTLHTFDSEAVLHNGPEAGVTWGITEGKTWRRTGGNTQLGADANIAFMLPTVHYFTELPQRITEAGSVQYVGEQQVRGTVYDVVYATWGSLAAHAEHDQYLVYINPQTGRIDKVFYTVREMAGFVSGACHLDDQRNIDGYWVPFQMSVTTAVDDDPDAYMHRMQITDFDFDRT